MTFFKSLFIIAVSLLFLTNGMLMAGDTVQTILDSKKLKTAYNGVLVDFLLAEGKTKLSKQQHKMALDQVVTALKERTTVTKKEQLNAALGNLVGVAMRAAGGDVVGAAGRDVEGYYAGEWSSWIDAAYKLLEAGYKEDAIRFFQYGMKTMPYPSLKARCVQGLALAKPESAYDLLMGMLKEPTNEVKAGALRQLGYLAADKNLPAEKKKAIIDTLVKYSKGLRGDEVLYAVIHAFSTCKAEEGKAVLHRLKKGLRAKEVKRDAFRCLLLDYKDDSVIPALKKKAKGGFLKDVTEQFYAGSLLIQTGDEAGFLYAEKALKYKKKKVLSTKRKGVLSTRKKGLLSSKKEAPDFQPAIVSVLADFGGAKGKEVLLKVIEKYNDRLWIKTWMALGLMQLGDTSHLVLLKARLNYITWDFTALRIAEVFAKNGDFSGIPVMAQLMKKRAGVLAGKREVNRLARLRIQIADSLAGMNHEHSVPLLIQLLYDPDIYVRSSAVMALCKMPDAKCLDGLVKAINVDYGKTRKGYSRNPGIHAHIARAAAKRFAKDPRTKTILSTASKSNFTSVRFLALAAK